MENDFTVAKVGWLTQRKGNEHRRAEILQHFMVFIDFLQSNSLVLKPLLGPDQTPDDEFAIRKSDLTEDGLELVKRGYDKWLQKIIDKGKDTTDVSILEKVLWKLRSRKE